MPKTTFPLARFADVTEMADDGDNPARVVDGEDELDDEVAFGDNPNGGQLAMGVDTLIREAIVAIFMLVRSFAKNYAFVSLFKI